MIRRPTVSTRTDTLFSCTTLFRSHRRHRVRGDRRVLLPARDEGDVLRRAGRRADPGASGAPAAGRVLDQRDLAAGPGLRLEPAHGVVPARIPGLSAAGPAAGSSCSRRTAVAPPRPPSTTHWSATAGHRVRSDTTPHPDAGTWDALSS